MNILEHPIYKDIYDLCQEIEKLPASEQATKVVIMASNLEMPAAQLIGAVLRLDSQLTEIKAAIAALGEQCGVRTYFDASPIQNTECSKRWLRLNRALSCAVFPSDADENANAVLKTETRH